LGGVWRYYLTNGWAPGNAMDALERVVRTSSSWEAAALGVGLG
jgi:hypothetical protein